MMRSALLSLAAVVGIAVAVGKAIALGSSIYILLALLGLMFAAIVAVLR